MIDRSPPGLSLLPQRYGAGLPLVHHRQDVGVVLRASAERVRSAELEVDGVFTRRQGRQRYPEPIAYRRVLTRGHIEDVSLLKGQVEERRLRTNYPIAINLLTVDRNLYVQLGSSSTASTRPVTKASACASSSVGSVMKNVAL